MNFLDKLTKVAEDMAQKVEKASKAATDIYKKDGVDGLLNQADKAFDKVGEKATKMGEKTTQYIKEVQKKNKEVIQEVNKKTTNDLEAKINVGVAATVNTVNVVTEDLIKMGKKVFSNLSDTPKPTEGKESSEVTKKVHTVEPTLDSRYNQLNQLPLKSVLKFIGAKQGESASSFVDKSGNTVLIAGNKWYSFKNELGGQGAVSFFAYHLSNFKSVDYQTEKKSLMIEAMNVLEQFSLSHHIEDEDKPKVEVTTKAKPKVKKVEPAVKAPAKKVVKKSVPEPVFVPKKVTRKSKP